MVARFGFWAAIASFVFAVAYGIPQALQVAGILTFPYDEIWIFAPSLLLAPSFVLANAALYETTPGERRIFNPAERENHAEWGPAPGQLVRHRCDRGDADAARDEAESLGG